MLRDIIKRYVNCKQLRTADAAYVRSNVHLSSSLSQAVKAHADGSEWYIVKPVGDRRVRMLCLCYAKAEGESCLPMPLSKLEARASTRKKAEPKHPAERKLVHQACRAIAGVQTEAFRKAFWVEHFASVEAAVLETPSRTVPYPRCPLSGKSIWSNKTHVDHVYPFVLMVDDWLLVIGLTWTQIQCVRSRKLKRMSMGPALDESWRQYHADNAQLAIVEAKANMSKGAKFTAKS